jgi:hypothetical protein
MRVSAGAAFTVQETYHSGWPSWSLEVEDNSGEPIQANPNKTKQNCLDFHGFIRPNCDLSVGYAQKNKKIRFRLTSCPGLRAKVCYRSHGLQTSTTGFRFQEDFSRTSNSPQSPKLLVELERCDAFPPTVGELAEILTIERSALG